jgi:hypothetical protein
MMVGTFEVQQFNWKRAVWFQFRAQVLIRIETFFLTGTLGSRHFQVPGRIFGHTVISSFLQNH